MYCNSFNCESLLALDAENFSSIRVTLDYPEDLYFLDRMIWSYRSIASSNTAFDSISGKVIHSLLNSNGLNTLHEKCIAAAAC